MSEEIFEVGQTVELKSGGPLMTIEEINSQNPNYIGCIWYDDENKTIQRQQFLKSLVRHEDGSYLSL